MAIEKTILTVDLYDNVLTERLGDYVGKVRITGTLHSTIRKLQPALLKQELNTEQKLSKIYSISRSP